MRIDILTVLPEMIEGMVQQEDSRRRAQRAHDIDRNSDILGSDEHGEKPRNELEHRVSWGMAHFQFV